MEMQDNSVLVRISFLIEYKNRMISIEEKQPIALSLDDSGSKTGDRHGF